MRVGAIVGSVSVCELDFEPVWSDSVTAARKKLGIVGQGLQRGLGVRAVELPGSLTVAALSVGGSGACAAARGTLSGCVPCARVPWL